MTDYLQPKIPATPDDYAYERPDCVIKSVDFSKYPALVKNWKESKGLLEKLKETLAQSGLDPRIRTIAAAGSLGRMEACQGISDGDLIIVLSDDIPCDGQVAEKLYQDVWQAIQPICSQEKIEKPKPEGLFGQATTCQQLLKEMGNANESLNIFGRRLLLLLETQPIYNKEEYDTLISQVLDTYASGYVGSDARKEWTLLINDLIRYFRSLAVNYQWDFERAKDKWLIRNIKLRHSRTLMYSGLLFLLGEASKEREDKVVWLKDKLKMTPLERLDWVYYSNSDWSFFRIAGCYNTFLHSLNQTELRRKLNIGPQENPSEYRNRYEIPEFSALKANSDGLSAELLRFVMSRRNIWTERFFEYLIF